MTTEKIIAYSNKERLVLKKSTSFYEINIRKHLEINNLWRHIVKKRGKNLKFRSIELLVISVFILLAVTLFLSRMGIIALYTDLFRGILYFSVGISFIVLVRIMFKSLTFNFTKSNLITKLKEYFIGLLVLIRTIFFIFIIFCLFLFAKQAIFNDFELSGKSITMKVLGILAVVLAVKSVPRYKKYCKEHPSKQGEIVSMFLFVGLISATIFVGIYEGGKLIFNTSLDLVHEDIDEIYIYDITAREVYDPKHPSTYEIRGNDKYGEMIVFPINKELYKIIINSNESEKKCIYIKYYTRTNTIYTYELIGSNSVR